MIRVGTRASRLARAQASRVAQRLEAEGHPTKLVPTDTLGDRRRKAPVHELGVAGAFTSRLEAALREEEVDLAVHSLKDLPIETAPGLTVAAVLERGRPGDVLIIDPEAYDPSRSPPLAAGARVATSGPRRRSQLLSMTDELTIVDVRGNVDTRVAKLREGWFDALVTAGVVLDRIQLPVEDLIVHGLAPSSFPPAPGQAAIAVQARQGSPSADVAAKLDHEPSRQAVEAERRLLGKLGGGCGLPLGAWVRYEDDGWVLSATFAGHGWDPTCRGQLRRVGARGPEPPGLVERFAGDIDDIDPQPRRPRLEDVPNPEGPPILVVASEPTARTWTAILRDAGGRAAEPLPTRRFRPTDPEDAPLPDQDGFDWVVLTSRQAVAPLAEALDDPLDAYVAAVGPATARCLQAHGLGCHLVPAQATGRGLAEAIDRVGEGSRVLLAQSDVVHGEAADHLDDLGFAVERWQAYGTEEIDLDPAELGIELPAPAALVMSPRNARSLSKAGVDRVARRLVALGDSTAAELQAMGYDPIVAPDPRPDAVLEVLP